MPPLSTAPGDTLAAMRAATRALHAEAERSGFVAELLAGRATLPGYVLWLRNLWIAYDALEAALPHSPIGPLIDRRVFRAAALMQDLEVLGGPAWRALPPLPEGVAYGDHVRAAARTGDAALLAHAYVRYLGDLNGGRALRRVVERSLKLDARALGFYDYPEHPAALEAACRAGLESAGRAADDDRRAAEAAAHAFRLNIALSEAVLAAVR
jgi:heme oxygenase